MKVSVYIYRLSTLGENAVQFFNRTLHRVVYDDVIEFILLGKLALRRFQTLLHLSLIHI